MAKWIHKISRPLTSFRANFLPSSPSFYTLLGWQNLFLQGFLPQINSHELWYNPLLFLPNSIHSSHIYSVTIPPHFYNSSCYKNWVQSERNGYFFQVCFSPCTFQYYFIPLPHFYRSGTKLSLWYKIGLDRYRRQFLHQLNFSRFWKPFNLNISFLHYYLMHLRWYRNGKRIECHSPEVYLLLYSV